MPPDKPAPPRTLAEIYALLPESQHAAFHAAWKAVDLDDLVAVARLREDWQRLAVLLSDPTLAAELKAFVKEVRKKRSVDMQVDASWLLDWPNVLPPWPRQP